MLEFIRDPLWQFIGALIAFIGVVVTIVFILKQRSKKELSINTLQWNPILSISEKDKGDIVISYNKVTTLFSLDRINFKTP
jgi:hypothetical protein